MGTAARKARKRSGDPFERAPKVATPMRDRAAAKRARERRSEAMSSAALAAIMPLLPDVGGRR